MSLMELLSTPTPRPVAEPDVAAFPLLPPPDPGTRFGASSVALLAPPSQVPAPERAVWPAVEPVVEPTVGPAVGPGFGPGSWSAPVLGELATFTGRGAPLVIGPATVTVSPRAVAIDEIRGLAVEHDGTEWRVRLVAKRGKPLAARVPSAESSALVDALRRHVVPTLVASLVAQMQLGDTIEVGELELSHRYLRVGRREGAWGCVDIVEERGRLVVRDTTRDRRAVLARVDPSAVNAFVLHDLVAAGSIAFPSPW